MSTHTQLFKLLSDDTRLRMLLLLYREPLCVCELVGIMDVPQPRISKNMAKFKDLGLVKDDRKDKFIRYSLVLNHDFLCLLLETIAQDKDQTYHQDLLRLKDKEIYLSTCERPDF